jgi:predicted nucleic acid-binding protein
VLAWLLHERGADDVRRALARAEFVVASDLTLVECDRVLIRATALGGLAEAEAVELRARLAAAAGHWNLLRVDGAVVERARRPLPGEPIRTLDALHLASALVALEAVPNLALLSLDRRIRAAGGALGLAVLPG